MTISLKKRIAITLLLLIIVRLGVFLPVPGIDHDSFYSSTKSNELIGFLNIFSGGAFSTVGIFALGIVPYINASIIIQITSKILPSLINLQEEEGEAGRNKVVQITRTLALGWAVVQSLAISFWIRPYVFDWNLSFIIETTLGLTAGAMIEMWLAEIITEIGIGNGTSILIFFNIIANIPKSTIKTWILEGKLDFDFIKVGGFVAILFFFLLSIAVILQEAVKKITIISAKQLTEFGNSDTVSNYSYIPFKLYQGGIMPIIFASAIIGLPTYLLQVTNNNFLQSILLSISPNGMFFLPLYYCLILLFSFIYSSLILNPEDISKNLRKTGSSILGVKPGIDTVEYLKTTLNRLTFLGSLLLFIIAVMPVLISFLKIDIIKTVSPTSILILVGVAIQTTKQIQMYILSKEFENLTSQDKS
uniref:Preprotein translocase subunit SecY n=1 Tax=Porphyridium sordidum TaxID=28024 RepID=A0A1C9CE01_PORSO|nr:preprotein translocase subunit SecY [Porphyridium sordidum]AOM66574.1 preprotein translocase subunit SecY [Porphyridium sordidum]